MAFNTNILLLIVFVSILLLNSCNACGPKVLDRVSGRYISRPCNQQKLAISQRQLKTTVVNKPVIHQRFLRFEKAPEVQRRVVYQNPNPIYNIQPVYHVVPQQQPIQYVQSRNQVFVPQQQPILIQKPRVHERQLAQPKQPQQQASAGDDRTIVMKNVPMNPLSDPQKLNLDDIPLVPANQVVYLQQPYLIVVKPKST